ncbi:MAG: ribosome recycling factor [Clostridia bacterium]|nr:ribosome recycling factor [Clostridia bacterium]
MKQTFNECQDRMKKSVDSLLQEFSQLKAGRANPAILDKITVEYYGTATPIPQIGSVSVPEARTLVIQPWDGSILGEIEKAILKADIGINPTNDGKVIRLNFPALTEERRKDLAKEIHKLSENAKVAVRNIRRDAIDKYKDMKKKSEITEDDLKTCEKDVQDLTDKFIKEIDNHTAAKEKEIMTV